jgi:hypothetical protein
LDRPRPDKFTLIGGAATDSEWFRLRLSFHKLDVSASRKEFKVSSEVELGWSDLGLGQPDHLAERSPAIAPVECDGRTSARTRLIHDSTSGAAALEIVVARPMNPTSLATRIVVLMGDWRR